MHILWLVRTTLPQAAAACGLAGASDVSGSWLTGQLAALRACPDLQLTVLCVGKEDADGTADGVHYRVVRDTAVFAPLLQAERPDLVHIWGTEFDPADVMADAARTMGASEDAVHRFATVDDAVAALKPAFSAGDLVLVKASRAEGLDRFAKEVLA